MKYLLAILILLSACSTPDDQILYPGGPAVCEDGPEAPAVEVEPWTVTQAAPNAALIYGDYVYVVESQANTVSRVHLETGVHEPWVDVGNDRNPYDLALSDEYIVTTNYLSNTLTVAARSSGLVLKELSSPDFKRPSGIALHNGYAYIGNVDFINPTEGFGAGSLSIVNLESGDVTTLPTSAKNPQYLAVTEYDGKSLLLVSESGSIRFDEGVGKPDSDGALEVFDLSSPIPTDSYVAPLPVSTADTRIGAPGRPALPAIGARLFIPSGTAPVLFEFDLENHTWTRGSNNPIPVYKAENNALVQANVFNDLLYVTAFNHDTLYIMDPACDEVLYGPIELGQSDLLEGPLVPLLTGSDSEVHLFTAMSVANSISRIYLSFPQ